MWSCVDDGHFGFWPNSDGDEAFEIRIVQSQFEGVWCDIDITDL